METDKKEHLISFQNKTTFNESSHNNEYIVNINHIREQSPLQVENNCISTSKYTYLNCVPKILMEQFSKMANVYFLMIAIMQSINEISISHGKPVILLPLTVVILINGIKDFMEDWKRKKSDDEENNRKCFVYNKNICNFEEKFWRDIEMGDIIKVSENEYFPADLSLINTSETNGICYTETKNLDGETNLKFKQANGTIAEYFNSIADLCHFKGVLVTKPPNEFIYEFDGKLSMEIESLKNKEIFLDKNSFLLRGCSLKQTKFIYGFAIYIGHNTKIMKNSPNARTKISRIENIMNMQIIIIFCLQTFMSTIGAIFYLYWLYGNMLDIKNYIFLDENSGSHSSGFLFFFYRIGTWTLIFTNLVPISLLVTLEMIKYIQGIFISWDISIYDLNTNTPAKVQTSTLNEELGQVKFIFSDKTGTLTKNYMEYKKMSIGKYIYGVDNPTKKRFSDEFGPISNFNLQDDNFQYHLKNPNQENYKDIVQFFIALSTCHTVITEENKENKLIYQSSSPDEMALINCARYFKYIFKGRDINNNIFLDIQGKKQTFQLLNLLEYSSERKRMSVILKCPDNKIRLYCKGADTIVSQRISLNLDMISITDDHLMNFAQKGLRTLMVAYKEIPENVYNDWSDEYRNAASNLLDKDQLLPRVFDKIEKDLYLLGSTAIEDQLQDDVDDVLFNFIKTGIKVWVLTGDKTDTAKSIAFSCKLITHEFILFEFREKTNYKDIYDKITEFLSKVNSGPEKKYALIVSLDEINKIMTKPELIERFYQLSIRCNAVLCCRVTPKQKAMMVSLIRDRQPLTTTLAIGDGANDVNMITTAHIGIGILGVEGRQAARASDYSIGQFSYLKRLLFVHGRESYRKNSYVVCYNFYKNVLFVMPQFWFGLTSYFSGQTLYDPWIYQLYNIIFTCLPIIWFGIYDKEVSYDNLMNDTQYYVQGMIGKLFHSIRFWKWVAYGMIQAIFIYIFSFKTNSSATNTLGMNQDIFSNGAIAYSGIVLIVNVKILISTSTHSLISFILFFCSVISYYLVQFLMSFNYNSEIFNSFTMNFTSFNFFLSTIILVLMCLLFDLGINRLLLLYGIIADPLKIKAEEYEKKTDLRESFLQIEKEVNNHFTGAAFSQDVGQSPQLININ